MNRNCLVSGFSSQVAGLGVSGSEGQPATSRLLRGLLVAAVVALAAGIALHFASPNRFAASLPQAASRAAVSRVSLPLFFEPNQGQTDSHVKFLARGAGYGLFLTPDEAVLQLQLTAAADQPSGNVIRMHLERGNTAARVSGADPLPGKSNYLIGNNPSKWHRGIPQFARVNYEAVYPGIDLTYYGRQGLLEYDFRVAPGADPSQIVLNFDGAAVRFEDGSLVLSTGQGDLRFQAPVVYQQTANTRQRVEGRYRQLAENKIGFELGSYDRSRELVIDPTLLYSTYLGGSGSESLVRIAVDTGGNVYVAGSTTSPNFPVTAGVVQSTRKGPQNLFIAKLTPGTSPLIFATYLGSSGEDYAAGVAVDSNSNVYVAGTTTASDFPTTSNAFQTAALVNNPHGFVSKLDPNGITLLYSTYLAGHGSDSVSGLAIDAALEFAFVTGTTTSTDAISNGFPANLNAYQQTSNATTQFFVSKLNTNGSGSASMLYSTYFGGGNPVGGTALGGGIAEDGSGNIYITGGTDFLSDTGPNGEKPFPLLNAVRTIPGGTDAIAAKFNPNLVGTASLIYSTYLGGSLNDVGTAIAVDSANNTYVTGQTASSDFFFPTGLVAPFQGTKAPPSTKVDAFVVKIGNPAGTNTVYPMTYFTYLGGSDDDIGLAIAVDSVQAVHVAGSTASADLPVVNNQVQQAYGGNNDAFVGLISTTGTTGNYLTFLGGTSFDQATGVALDSNNDSSPTYVAGETQSSDFPLLNPLQPQLGGVGAKNAFIAQIGATSSFVLDPKVSPNPGINPNPATAGNQVTFTFSFVNDGLDVASNVIFSAALPPSGFTFTSASAAPGGACPAPIGARLLCQVGTVASGAPVVVSVILVPNSGTTSLNVTPTLIANDSQVFKFPGAQVPVTDFTIAVAPPSQEIAAGNPTSYTVTLTPQGAYASSVTVSQSGLPTAATGTFTATTITFSGVGGPQSTVLNISTIQRPVSTGNLRRGGTMFYATWLPVGGLSLLGVGATRKRRRWLAGALFGLIAALIMLQPACGSSSSTPPPTGGTPAGNYTLTITATAGTVSHNTRVLLKVD